MSEGPLQSECSAWFPDATSLPRECPYIECPYNEALLYKICSSNEQLLGVLRHSTSQACTQFLTEANWVIINNERLQFPAHVLGVCVVRVLSRQTGLF